MSYSSKHAIAQIISQRAKGRRIVFRGEDAELEEALKKDFDLSVEFFITAVREKADDVRTFHILRVKNQADQYFMVMPTLVYNESEKKLMTALGYKNKEDFLYVKHNPIVINTKDMENYEDEYGNRLVCGEAAVSVTFSGWGGYVEIGKNCKISKLSIGIRDDAVFRLGDNCEFYGDNSMVLWPKAEVTIERHCKFISARFSVFPGAYIYIHEDCSFGENLVVKPAFESRIIIGRDCMFSWDCIILGGDGHAIFDVNSRKRINWHGNTQISIGEHVWIGARCIILPDVKIACGSIIGAASTVKKSIPNNSIAAGSPAKVIRKNVAWNRDYAEQNIDKCPPEYVRLTEEDI